MILPKNLSSKTIGRKLLQWKSVEEVEGKCIAYNKIGLTFGTKTGKYRKCCLSSAASQDNCALLSCTNWHAARAVWKCQPWIDGAFHRNSAIAVLLIILGEWLWVHRFYVLHTDEVEQRMRSTLWWFWKPWDGIHDLGANFPEYRCSQTYCCPLKEKWQINWIPSTGQKRIIFNSQSGVQIELILRFPVRGQTWLWPFSVSHVTIQMLSTSNQRWFPRMEGFYDSSWFRADMKEIILQIFMISYLKYRPETLDQAHVNAPVLKRVIRRSKTHQFQLGSLAVFSPDILNASNQIGRFDTSDGLELDFRN